MTRVEFTEGPLDGLTREMDDSAQFANEYPGYSVTEERLDPDQGKIVMAQWSGDEAAARGYPEYQEQNADQTGAEQRQADQQRQQQQTATADQAGTKDTRTAAERRQADTATQQASTGAQPGTTDQADARNKTTGAEQRQADQARTANQPGTKDAKGKNA